MVNSHSVFVKALSFSADKIMLSASTDKFTLSVTEDMSVT